MLQEFSDKQDYIEFLQKENEKIRKRLKDTTNGEVRAEADLAIRKNEHTLIQRYRRRADFLKVIDENLTAAEFKVIQLRHIEGQQWKDVARSTHLSRSGCIRLENAGMEKLRLEWEQYLEKEAHREGEGE